VQPALNLPDSGDEEGGRGDVGGGEGGGEGEEGTAVMLPCADFGHSFFDDECDASQVYPHNVCVCVCVCVYSVCVLCACVRVHAYMCTYM
jgi:hypothetical protein